MTTHKFVRHVLYVKKPSFTKYSRLRHDKFDFDIKFSVIYCLRYIEMHFGLWKVLIFMMCLMFAPIVKDHTESETTTSLFYSKRTPAYTVIAVPREPGLTFFLLFYH